MVKDPNWQEEDQLAIYNHDRGVELGTTENKSRMWSEWDMNPGRPDFKFGALITGKPSMTIAFIKMAVFI